MLERVKFEPGAVVVYEMEKHSLDPGPRARNVTAQKRGDGYSYVVDKYWIVLRREADQVVLKTPKGKTRTVDLSHPNLRRPSLRERIWLWLLARERLHALREAFQEEAAIQGVKTTE